MIPRAHRTEGHQIANLTNNQTAYPITVRFVRLHFDQQASAAAD